MKNQNLILLGLGAAALFFMLRGRSRSAQSGSVAGTSNPADILLYSGMWQQALPQTGKDITDITIDRLAPQYSDYKGYHILTSVNASPGSYETESRLVPDTYSVPFPLGAGTRVIADGQQRTIREGAKPSSDNSGMFISPSSQYVISTGMVFKEWGYLYQDAMGNVRYASSAGIQAVL